MEKKKKKNNFYFKIKLNLDFNASDQGILKVFLIVFTSFHKALVY